MLEDPRDCTVLSSIYDSFALKRLLVIRHSLATSIHKASQLAAALNKSERKTHDVAERLSALQAVMVPFQAKANVAKGLSLHIHQAVQKASAVLKTFTTIHELERAAMTDLNDLQGLLSFINESEECLRFLYDNYGSTVKCLEIAVEFVGETKSADEYHLQRLRDTLCALKEVQSDPQMFKLDGGPLHFVLERLTAEFQRALVESNNSINLLSDEIGQQGDLFYETPYMDKSSILKLQAIANKLLANGKMHQCLDIYKQIRISTIVKRFRSLDADYLNYLTADAIQKLDWKVLESYIGIWVRHIPLLVNVLFAKERALCSEIFDEIMEDKQWVKCFGNIVEESNIVVFLQFGEVLALSEKQPEKLFKLLDMYEMLNCLKREVREVFAGEGCLEIRLRFRELQKQLADAASIVLREFGKRLVDTEMVPPPQNGSNDKICSYVVNYLLYLVDTYGPIMEGVLKTMQTGRDGGPGEKCLSFVVAQAMQALERNLEDRARRYYPDQTLKYIFLMNNYWYMFSRIKNSELGECLGDTWLKECKKKVDQHALRYRKAGWEKVLVQLRREGLHNSSGGRGIARDLMKQRLRTFNAAFEEAYHNSCRWSIPDEELRQGTQLAVVQLLVPTYSNYIEMYRSIIEQIGDHNLVKYSPAALESLLGDLFQGNTGRVMTNQGREGKAQSF